MSKPLPKGSSSRRTKRAPRLTKVALKGFSAPSAPPRPGEGQDGSRPLARPIQPAAIVISGTALDRATGEVETDAVINAFWRTPDGDVLAGTGVSDHSGHYRIRIAGDGAGDELVVRVVDAEGATLADSGTVPAPRRRRTVDLKIGDAGTTELSEAARLAAKLGGLPLANLRAKELVPIAKEIGESGERVRAFASAARLGRSLGASADLVYALLRKGQPANAESLSGATAGTIRKTLRSAVRERIVDEPSDTDLASLLEGLGTERAERTPVLDVLGSSATNVPPSLETVLRDGGIETLRDLRAAGGLAGRVDGTDDVARSLVERLDAHARLSAVASDPAVRETLIDKELGGPSAIARMDANTFARKVRTAIGKDDARALHREAVVELAVAKNAMAAKRAADPNGISELEHGIGSIRPPFIRCECDECSSAVSPLAYLADLMAYVKDNVTDPAHPNRRFDWRFLESQFRQPFGKLAVSCEAVEARVRQVRICIEVLRDHLADNPPTAAQAAALERAERDYLRGAYQLLLVHAGASLEELRLVQGASADARKSFAERIGISAPTQTVDHLHDLLIDTEPPRPLADIEAELEKTFGLRDTRKPPLHATGDAKLLQWRRERLRELWREQDWPEDLPAGGRPVVDPDVIGPDDFRRPTSTTDPFRLWVKRRRWVDRQLNDLAQIAVVQPGSFDALLDAMYQPHTYAITSTTDASVKWPLPKKELGEIRESLRSGGLDTDAIAQTLARLSAKYGLDADALNRLGELRDKAVAAADPRNAKLDDEEWSEARSILVQALKRLLFADWRQEEQDKGIDFGPRELWISLRDPADGVWPPVIAAGSPLVDPELLRPADLPDSSVGDPARALYDTRTDELEQAYDDLRDTRETASHGFEEMLKQALGDPLLVDLDQTLADLASSDTTVSAPAETAVRASLFMTVDDFRMLMTVRAKDAETDPYRKPTASEYADVYRLLVTAEKTRVRYPAWKTAETQAGLEYWQALKAALPTWRAPVEARTDWQRALRIRSRSPIVDPDLITQDYLRPPRGTQPPWSLWTGRRSAIDGLRAGLVTQRTAAASPAAGLDAIVNATLGATTQDLLAVDDAAARGAPIARRLDQLSLSQPAFDTLVRVARLLAANQPVLPTEWQAVYDVLVQAWKSRNACEWREAERATLTLSPDFFRLPPVDLRAFPPAPQRELPRWRATLGALLDWEDTLRSRIDLDASVASTLDQIVSTAEELTLPQLRDALVAAARLPGTAQPDRAKWLSDRLMIDMKCGGCATTTRVAQAIETIQSLLFLLRSGGLREVEGLETCTLRQSSLATFDADMAWMGSYSTWRAAMFVFLYPEGILLPSLRTEATRPFFELVQSLRSLGLVAPAQATAAGRRYAEYFEDVCGLETPWGVFADVALGPDEARAQGVRTETRLFLLALSPSGKVYWCTRRQSQAAETQTYWQEVPGLASVRRIVGAVPYDPSPPSSRYLFLFAETVELGQPKLVFLPYDLEKRTWAGSEPTELPPPDGSPFPTEIKLLQSPSVTTPPVVYVKFPDGSDGTRSLNQLGKEWEKQGFTPVHVTEVLAQRVDGSRHKSGLDDEPISAADPRPFFDRIMKWLIAADDYAKNAVPPFACGFPDFTQNGDRFGIIVLGDALVDMRTSGEFFNAYPTVSRFDELTMLWRNAVGSAYVTGTYQAAFPLFAKQGSTWVCDRVACVKALPGVTLQGAGFTWTQTDLASPVRGLLAADDNRFEGADFAGRFRWADEQVTRWRGADFLGIPTFADRSMGATWNNDYACSFPRTREVVAATPPEALSVSIADAWKPSFAGSFTVTPEDVGPKLQDRRAEEASAFAANAALPSSLTDYFDEAWYFVPAHIALQLQRSGHYREALDWFRLVYDYSATLGQRKIAANLVREQAAGAGFRREANWQWLRDPLNPHRIARTRSNTYTRFTLLAIVRCLLEYAESEYTRDTPESVPLARLLFEMALRLLGDRELVQSYARGCEDVIGELEIQYGDAYTELVEGTDGDWHSTLTLETVTGMVPAIERILNSKASAAKKAEKFGALVAEKRAEDDASRPDTVAELVQLEAKAGDDAVDGVLMQPELSDGLRRMNGAAFAGDGAGYGESLVALAPPDIVRIPAALITACIPPNPMLRALRLRAEANLYKIRTCRSIAGLKRELEPYAAPTDTVTGMPSIGAGGQLTVPGLTTPRPTPYRYATLIERSKQMVQLAQQVENAMLSALQQADSEAYTLLKARQDVQHSAAGVTLQDLRLTEAQDGVDLAALQRDRADIQAKTYEEWIDAGLNTWESVMVGAYIVSAVNQTIAAGVSPWLSVTTPYGAAIAAVASAAGSIAATSQGIANVASVYASLERRRQEWELSRELARQDVAIGNEQLRIAQDNVRVTTQERVIAQLEADNASRTVEFLSTKFTNVELYDWMADVLAGVYRYFLQQSTSVAQLAQSQLAFERQETPPPFIQADYWEPPSQGGSGGESPDRRGLTGSARLLQDIYQLDQYWFETNTRKLQLTKTISLAQFAPVELQQFRESGVMTFATPMELFDRDFPGHYLRLVKRVRTSVVALVPVTAGIKATLTSARLSRTVTGGDLFQTVRIQHGPDSVALTSPVNATGLFELDGQTELLAPFEGIGVDTLWELRMPRAANPFDYRTIADVLLTIDYTALNSLDHRDQVTQRLGRTISADRPYSFRTDFADAWYDLHNPDTTATPMTVAFRVEEADFPRNLDDVRIAHLALYFGREDGSGVELQVGSLALSPDTSTGTFEGGGTTSEGLISTRRGNAGSWMAMIGQSPVGHWQLSLPDTAAARRLFADEAIADILLVVTYAGRLPPWPS
jgi:hypothetical protein